VTDPAAAAVPQRPFAVPPDATEVVLVRHGASEAAVPGERFELLEGRGNPALARAGRDQAEAVAARLRSEQLSAIYVTPLRRTSETAAPLASALGLDPVVVPELVEVHLGEWDGGEYRVRFAAGDPLVARIFAEERWDLIPGAETPEALSARVRAGIERVVADTGPGAAAVAVVHGGVIGEVCRQATRSSPFSFIHADNGSITRLVVLGNGRWLLRSFNDTAHLIDAMIAGP
jgi:probable phosphoglycerate mutase